MRNFIIIFAFIMTYLNTGAQSVLATNLPNVSVAIKLLNAEFACSDSVKFIMSINNTSDSVQKLLFDKPLGKTFPWGTNAMVKNNTGLSMVKFSNRETISSQLYTEEQLEKKGYYYKLKPGQSISHTYYLSDIPIFKTIDGKLPKGKYSLLIEYFLKKSNTVRFTIQ